MLKYNSEDKHQELKEGMLEKVLDFISFTFFA